MRRINFTLDQDTVNLLGSLAHQFYGGNRSLAIRAAVESLAAHSGHAGWVVTGFTPVQIEARTPCRGISPEALDELPAGKGLDCSKCAGGHL